ncbi:unnamed protein product, partial [Discosporangium mesarthrocarpum]
MWGWGDDTGLEKGAHLSGLVTPSRPSSRKKGRIWEYTKGRDMGNGDDGDAQLRVLTPDAMPRVAGSVTPPVRERRDRKGVSIGVDVGFDSGLTVKGVTVKGVTVKGLITKGVTAKDVTVKGIAVKGITAKGVAAKGVPADRIHHPKREMVHETLPENGDKWKPAVGVESGRVPG